MRARSSSVALFLLALLLPAFPGLALLGSRAAEPRAKDVEAVSAGKTFDAGRKWAVVIGVNKYLDLTIPKLRYSVADARLVAQQLAEKCGYDESRILVLTDDQAKDHLRPLRTNLLKQVPSWLENAAPGDTVLVYFSGHGFCDKQGQAYLAPQDCDRQNLEASGVRTNELKAMLERCRATQKFLVLDCCHSGGKALAGPGTLSSREMGEVFGSARGLLTLASCKVDEESQEWEDKKQGLFTYFLAEGLAGAADADGNGIVDSDELYKYVYDRVRTVGQKDLGVQQTPVRIIGADVEGVFGLTRVKPGESSPVSSVSHKPNDPPEDSHKPSDVRTEVHPAAQKNGDRTITVDLGGEVKMELVRIPRGKFLMGSPRNELERSDDEDQHEVEITHDFYLGKFPVTQEQYRAVMGQNPSWFAVTGGGRRSVQGQDTARFPVENLTWESATAFCDKLTTLQQGNHRTFRLPTEAEWEYACRGGTTTPFYFGTSCNGTLANCFGEYPSSPGRQGSGDDEDRGTKPSGPFLQRTSVVGAYEQKAPHPWGLADMHGNVMQWCQDFYVPYADLEKKDPVQKSPRNNKDHVARGGAYKFPAALCRAASRFKYGPTSREPFLGFRVAVSVD